MKRLQSSAPGKVVLSGEYAVLDGAPAVSMAVNRRAVVTLDAAATAAISSLGLRGKTDTRLFDAVQTAWSLAPWEGAAVLDTRAFADPASGRKFGIGSSAALAAALAAAFAPSGTAEEELFAVARRAHREFQRDTGSGVDVATGVFGGLIEYIIDESPRRLAWPRDLCFALLWSGEPANTAQKLARLEAAPKAASRSALGAAAARVAAAWAGGDAARLLGEYRDYLHALRSFDVDHGLGIFDAGHDALLRATQTSDLVYKPCGAGGGDIGIVFGLEEGAVRAFCATAACLGFRPLDMTMETAGVRVTGV